MNLDHDFVQMWKFSEDQKKSKWNTFFPNSGEDQKKKKKKKGLHQKQNTSFPQNQMKTQKKRSSTGIEHFFTQIYAQMYSVHQYLNCKGDTGDASPHRYLASPRRDLASPHRHLGVPPSRFERWVIRRKRASQHK